MVFDIYYSEKTKDGSLKPGTRPVPMEWNTIVTNILRGKDTHDKISKYRETGDVKWKQSLTSINLVGRSVGTRKRSDMKPTQLVMVDIDHCENPRFAYDEIRKTFEEKQGEGSWDNVVALVHETPSHGLHIFFKAQGETSLEAEMDWFNSIVDFSKYGDFDKKVKDFSRVSFAFLFEEMYYENKFLYLPDPEMPGKLTNPEFGDTTKNGVKQATKSLTEEEERAETEARFTEEERAEFDDWEYRGTPLKVIIEKYVEEFGKPGKTEIHNYYNDMVKNFRNIMDNNRRALLYLLPRFGHTIEECESQINSITRVNTLSYLPKEFYFFLKRNGFKPEKGNASESALKNFMLGEKETEDDRVPPYLPPVFRELVGTAPIDFILPTIDALLPILGTLTSYAQAVYPYDNRVHTTSFFSIIYAPPSTGKGFIERFIDMLFEDLVLRDLISSEREKLYLQFLNRKGNNEKSPKQPEVSCRIFPTKNSETEFLEKTFFNKGYHMFTYAAEMDSWAKGVRAAGGNKDDMIRIAWDNGEYGQQFKSPTTFKGKVRLYWNVLITGTLQQVESYFRNVENGLVTRCSFTGIENQEFVLAPHWKPLSKKAKEVIRNFRERCDRNSYETPCTIDPFDIVGLDEEKFDKEIDWHFQFKPRKSFDCSWIMPTINEFQKEQCSIASKDVDHARDVFRRRVGVRGFRLALLCMCLWEKPTKAQLDKCKIFIKWFMRKDLEKSLQLWGNRYNEIADVAPDLRQRSVFESLKPEFDRNDVYVVCMKSGIKSPVRQILYDWKKNGFIESIDKNHYKKLTK